MNWNLVRVATAFLVLTFAVYLLCLSIGQLILAQ